MSIVKHTKLLVSAAAIAALSSASALASESWSISVSLIGDGHGLDGSPYSWYHEGGTINWKNPIGMLTMPNFAQPAPYDAFDLTAATTNGHCFELKTRPTSNLGSGVGMWVGDHGVVKMVNFPSPGAYSKTRVWVKRASGGPTVGARILFATPYQVPPPSTASVDLSIMRLELDRTACLVNGIPWASWEGTATDYVFTKGNF